jgi:hypothetical protein
MAKSIRSKKKRLHRAIKRDKVEAKNTEKVSLFLVTSLDLRHACHVSFFKLIELRAYQDKVVEAQKEQKRVFFLTLCTVVLAGDIRFRCLAEIG